MHCPIHVKDPFIIFIFSMTFQVWFPSMYISRNLLSWSMVLSSYYLFQHHHVLLLLLPLNKIQWASYQIRKIAGCACAGNAGNVFPRRRFQRKPIVGDPGMHHGTCVTHVPWCMSGSLTCGDGENVPGIPGACAPAILRIWQEAHENHDHSVFMSSFIWFCNCNICRQEIIIFI